MVSDGSDDGANEDIYAVGLAEGVLCIDGISVEDTDGSKEGESVGSMLGAVGKEVVHEKGAIWRWMASHSEWRHSNESVEGRTWTAMLSHISPFGPSWHSMLQ